MLDQIPFSYPLLWCILWFSVGYGIGKIFASLDYYMRWKIKIEEKEGLPKPVAKLILSILDAFHHFQLGLFIMCLEWKDAVELKLPWAIAGFMLGLGLVAHDAEDLRKYVKRYYEVVNHEQEK